VARDYLTTRHLDLETVQPLGLGYAAQEQGIARRNERLGRA